jgi:hypothetical protein
MVVDGWPGKAAGCSRELIARVPGIEFSLSGQQHDFEPELRRPAPVTEGEHRCRT